MTSRANNNGEPSDSAVRRGDRRDEEEVRGQTQQGPVGARGTPAEILETESKQRYTSYPHLGNISANLLSFIDFLLMSY